MKKINQLLAKLWGNSRVGCRVSWLLFFTHGVYIRYCCMASFQSVGARTQRVICWQLEHSTGT